MYTYLFVPMCLHTNIYTYIYTCTQTFYNSCFFYAHCNCMYILCICAQLIGNIYLFVTYMYTACAYVVCLWMYTCMCISMYVYSHMYNITERSFFFIFDITGAVLLHQLFWKWRTNLFL